MFLSQTKQITMVRADFDVTLASTMPLRLSDDLKERIILWYYIDQMTMEDIHDLAKCSIGIRRCSARSLISPQSPWQWGGHWTHLCGLLNWSQQERISWVTNGRHMLESSKTAKSWRQGDGWQERRADYLDFITAVRHCLAQEHLTWPFLEKFRFSQNYAKHCKIISNFHYFILEHIL